MASEKIQLKIQADIGAAQKKLADLKKSTNDTRDSIGIMGVTWGGVKAQFTKFKLIAVNGLKVVRTQIQLASLGIKSMFAGSVIKGAKTLFNVIKVGIASTGIGLLLVAFAGLVQYFSDSEKGASKFKQITAQLGVVVGNVTDIISDLGKSVFKLVTGDFQGFKDGLKEVGQGVKDFGELTRKEMGEANQLEKDRLALQIFERKAMVDKAEAQKEMMRLRLKARDEDNFSAKERVKFMNEATRLAEVQLEKDLHVAKEKLRMQIAENGFSKSTEKNLEAEAQLEADVFRIQTANFSERKRMEMETIALKNQAKAQDKADSDAILSASKEVNKERQALLLESEKIAADIHIKGIKDTQEKEQYILNEAFNEKKQKIKDSVLLEADKLAAIELLDEQHRINTDIIDDKFNNAKILKDKAASDKLSELKHENLLLEIEDKTEKSLADLDFQESKELKSIESMENSEALKTEIKKKYAKKRDDIDKASAKLTEVTEGMKLNAISNGLKALGSLAGEHKALAVAQATIDGYSAVQGALSDKTVPSTALRMINAVSMGVMAVANVKKILSTSVPNATGGGGGMQNTDTVTPNNTFVGGNFDLSGGASQQPIEAFVVTDSMTNSQDKLSNIRRRATI